MNVKYLVENFASIAGIETFKMDNEHCFSITIEEFEIFIAYVATKKTILLHASIDSLSDEDMTVDYLHYLLEMNTFFAKTYGLCLGIDKGVVTAQQNIYVVDTQDIAMHVSVYNEQFAAFLEAVAKLLAYFTDATKVQQDMAAIKAATIPNATSDLTNKGVRC